jgi:hypothetical protein
MVTGIRQDAYANKNRIPNSVEKEVNNKGKYMHPDAFGQPAAKGINYLSPSSEPSSTNESPVTAKPSETKTKPVFNEPQSTDMNNATGKLGLPKEKEVRIVVGPQSTDEGPTTEKKASSGERQIKNITGPQSTDDIGTPQKQTSQSGAKNKENKKTPTKTSTD